MLDYGLEEKNNNHNYKIRDSFIKYEVNSEDCELEIGEMIEPDTLIGYHYLTYQPVIASRHSYVATSYFNPMHNSQMILVLSLERLFPGGN